MSFLKGVKARVTKNEKAENEKKEAQNTLMQTKVTLPKTGKEMTINELVAEVDERDFSGFEASLEDYVHIDGVKITFKEALKKIEEFAPGKTVVEIFTDEAPEVTEEVTTENEEDKDPEDKEDQENEEDKEEKVEDKNTSTNSNFNALMSAGRKVAPSAYQPSYKTVAQRAENGRGKYGRGK